MSEYSDDARRCATADRTTTSDQVLRVAVAKAAQLARHGDVSAAEATLAAAGRRAERILGPVTRKEAALR